MVDEHSKSPHFATTRWSIVLKAGRDSSVESAEALSELCENYWYPLYAYVRRKGKSPEDSQDLTQSFFSKLLEKELLRNADQDRGRFRTYLLTLFQRYLANEHAAENALKRGGGVQLFSMSFETAEERYRLEPTEDWTPERIYERRWALTLLEGVMKALRNEYEAAGNTKLYQHCQPFLAGASATLTYKTPAEALNMNEGAVRVAVHRMRKRYQELLQQHVAQTVDQTDNIEDELHQLRSAIRGG